jgi:hypothetical protein
VKLSSVPLILAMSAGGLAGLGARTSVVSVGLRSAAAGPREPPTSEAPAGANAAATDHESVALPWLRGFAVTAETAEAGADVVDRMARWREPDDRCSAAAYGGLAITADVAKARGNEQVLASFTQGVLVLDARGQLIASATALPCQGSADEVEAIAAGDAHIDRAVIALAVTTGGHRESSTWLALYGVAGGVLAPLFTGKVEEHLGTQTRVGAVTLLPGALLYRAPSGVQTMWVYSEEHQRYSELALVVPPGV